jgi:hypothetical protein
VVPKARNRDEERNPEIRRPRAQGRSAKDGGDEQDRKALGLAITQIERQFGKGA